MSRRLVARESAAAWELRSAWATGRRVSLRLEGADEERVAGRVTSVSATDAFVLVEDGGEIHVPLSRVLSVRRPHFSEPRDARVLYPEDRPEMAPEVPGQLRLADGRPPGKGMIGRVYLLRGERWCVIARGAPFDRGPRRNVLIEREADGRRVVRPFRGLRRAP